MVSRAKAERSCLLLLFVQCLYACASSPVAPDIPHPAPDYAIPPAADGAFAGIESSIRDKGGESASGFMLLDRNEDGLKWRLALIDSAKYSIDAQYYIWYDDAAGNLLIKRLLDAADRGVKVRLLVDDLNTVMAGATTVRLRDKDAALVNAHPNFELRLFNPWTRRGLGGRLGEVATDTKRLNQRMHNKLIVVDNRATIIGGRNIGDDYMGLHEEYNFHDLDVLCVGPVAREASDVFDTFWNSKLTLPASALEFDARESDRRAAGQGLLKRLGAEPSLAGIPIAPQDWTAERSTLPGRLRLGVGHVSSDTPGPGGIEHRMIDVLRELAAPARSELLVINAYIIPSQPSIDLLRTLHERNVKVGIVTNSLASHDVPAVNSHYKAWRKPILQAGAQLFEIRHDAAIQSQVSDTPPTRAKFMGLHSKGVVVDRERVFVGSMNFDPRSGHINSEMGVVIESKDLAEDLATTIERDMLPANSWHVELDDAGKLRWTDDEEVVTRQPARSFWQRVQDVVFKILPRDLY